MGRRVRDDEVVRTGLGDLPRTPWCAEVDHITCFLYLKGWDV